MSVQSFGTDAFAVSREEVLMLLFPGIACIRAGAHGISFKIATGEAPTTTVGWQRDTTLDRYDELDTIGKIAVRCFPFGIGALIAEVLLRPFLRRPATGSASLGVDVGPTLPSGWMLVLVGYLACMWVVLVAYDPFWGLIEGVREQQS